MGLQISTSYVLDWSHVFIHKDKGRYWFYILVLCTTKWLNLFWRGRDKLQFQMLRQLFLDCWGFHFFFLCSPAGIIFGISKIMIFVVEREKRNHHKTITKNNKTVSKRHRDFFFSFNMFKKMWFVFTIIGQTLAVSPGHGRVESWTYLPWRIQHLVQNGGCLKKGRFLSMISTTLSPLCKGQVMRNRVCHV